MRFKNTFTKLSIAIVPSMLICGAATSGTAQVLVDSYLGGTSYSSSPFAGQTATTPAWQNVGGFFTPSITSDLTQFDVSIYAETGTQGAAQLTIYSFNQPPGNGVYVSPGPSLGSATVPVAGQTGSYNGLVAFNFSSQNILLQAGQTYAFMLSDPQSAPWNPSAPFNPAWRQVDYTFAGGLEINSESQFTNGGFDYATVDTEARQHYEVFATPAPEPGALALGAAMIGALAWKKGRRR